VSKGSFNPETLGLSNPFDDEKSADGQTASPDPQIAGLNRSTDVEGNGLGIGMQSYRSRMRFTIQAKPRVDDRVFADHTLLNLDPVTAHIAIVHPLTAALSFAILALLHAESGAAETPTTSQSPSPDAALVWTERNGFRERAIPPVAESQPGFTLMSPSETGLRFINSIPEARHLTNQILLNGSGLAAGDVDGDGWTDVFFAGFDNENALFRNHGQWRFEDITESSGTALPNHDCTGAAFADLDGDSDLDLIVNTLAQGTLILINDGRAHFKPLGPPLHPGHGAMTASLGDIDGDGFLDLYVANYRTLALMDMPNTRMTFKKVDGSTVVDTVNGRPASSPEFAGRFSVNASGGIEEHGEPDVLFRNQGGTNLVPVSWADGSFLDESGKPLQAPPRDWGLAAMFRDVNRDGHPDLYVCNDFQSPDRLWLNLGNGRFQLAPATAIRRTSLSSMAVDFSDINRDGHDDFLVLEMLSRDHERRMRWVRENFPHQPIIGLFTDRPQIEQNTLQLSRGDGSWAEIAQFAGLEATEWAWGCAFLDVDLDGWEDVLVVNGMERAARDLDAAEKLRANRQGRRLTDREIFEARRIFPRLATPNLAFRNQGDLTFHDSSQAWGFDLPAVSQSLALADLDNDGDLDVLVGNLNQAAAIYRNNAPGPRIGIRLAGLPPNTRGIGARIELLDSPRPQSQEMIAGGRYLAGDDPIRSFAVPTNAPISIRVRWPNGNVSEVQDAHAQTLIEIQEATSRRAPDPAPQPPGNVRFEDVSSAINHRHHEEPFDDFARQPLLPRKLSQPGPGIAWIDLDQDRDEDLVIGTGLNGRLAVFQNDGSGRFQSLPSSSLANPMTRDVTGLACLPTPKNPLVLAALSNVEDAAPLGSAVIAWDSSKPSWSEIASATDSSPGPLALADIDADGDLDLFVGGRVIPGRWPLPASSRFLRNENGKLTPDSTRSRILSEIGMVTGAVFSDFDSDGDADLVLAIEFGPVTFLRQDPGGFTNVTSLLGLSGFRGAWTSIAAGDFDNDGRTDFIAGNWGRNTPYERFRSQPANAPAGTDAFPIQILHGDFDNDGTYDVLEAVFASPPGKIVPMQPLTMLAQALPMLRGRFPSHAAFAVAGLKEILGETMTRARSLAIPQWESVLLLNRDGTFETKPLPVEAQLAPVFSMAIADADGDGNEDVFLAQNFFAVRPHTPRYDGGAGLWLRGDGRGGFRAIPPTDSGIIVHGEQRSAAVADFDRDGRVDLAVGQNGSQTRLFRNTGGHPGVTFHLAGPPQNSAGIGARLRWVGERAPVREIRSGQGSLAQDGLSLPMARPEGARSLEVVWPGGTSVAYPVPTEKSAWVLHRDGRLEALPQNRNAP